MIIEVYSKQDTLNEDIQSLIRIRHVWISVNTPGEPELVLPQNEYRLDHLNLWFDDCRYENFQEFGENNRELIKFDSNMAFKVIEFVEKFKTEVECININCRMGISRSAAIASCLDSWLNNRDHFANRKLYRPNSICKKILSEEIDNRCLI